MASPYFSVVIPTYNEEHWLPRLLGALARQTDSDFEVIIVDGGSTDRTKELAEAWGARLPAFRFLPAPKGVSPQKNFGGRHAAGEYLMFFDADVLPEDGFIQAMKNHVSGGAITMATVWNRADCRHLVCRFFTRFISLAMVVSQWTRPGAVGVCIVMRRAFFLEIKGFDESVVDGEDWELTNRASKLGATFKVFRLPRLYISGRRFEKEGFWKISTWFLAYLFHSLSKGSIKKKVFEYKMGGSEFYDQRPIDKAKEANEANKAKEAKKAKEVKEANGAKNGKMGSGNPIGKGR